MCSINVSDIKKKLSIALCISLKISCFVWDYYSMLNCPSGNILILKSSLGMYAVVFIF